MAQLAMLGGGMGGMMSMIMPLFTSVIGMFLQPGQKDEVGKLNDLKVSTSAYGEGIAIVYGTMRVPGNMFWATEFEEEKRYINSKGKDVTGKKKDDKKGKPVYEYYANYAMGLCEGPVGEVLRIWADSNLIYDKYNPDNEDLVGPGFTDPDDAGGSKTGKGAGTGKKGGSQDSGRFHFRFYNGSEGQNADPHMTEKNLEFNDTATPAHRGLCYLYFERFAIADFGNRIPTITAEVAAEHFRKPVFTYFKQLEESFPEKVTFATTAPFTQLFFDPIRYRAYTVSSDSALRVWDLTTRQEYYRIMLEDIPAEEVIQTDHPFHSPGSLDAYNSWYETYYDYYAGTETLFNGVAGVNYATSMHDMSVDRIIGVAASGDLIGSTGSANNDPIMFIDSESFTVKSRFGTFGNQLQNTNESMQSPVGSYVLSSYDPQQKIPIYYTVVQSLFGDMYFFNDSNRVMSFYTFGGSIYSPQGKGLSPGIPESNGTTFFLYSPQVLFDVPSASIYACQFLNGAAISYSGTGSPRTIGIPTEENSLSTGGEISLIYQSLPEDDETGRSITLPCPVVGAEALGFIEMVYGNTVHPEKNGAWAVKLGGNDEGDDGWEVKWRAKISTSTFDPEQNECHDSVILSGFRLIYRFSDTTVWDIDFDLEKIDVWFLPTDAPPTNPTQWYFPTKGCIYQEANNIPEERGGGTTLLEAFLDKMIQKEVTPAEILKDLADRVGIGAERIDHSKLDDDKITGYVVQQPMAARRVADDLMKIFFFDIAESDYLLKAVSRRQSVSAVTVPQADLGFIQGDTPADAPSDYYKETRVQEIDLPQTVVVSYIDPKDDYESGSQHWRRPRSPMPVMQSREILNVNVPMAMQADFAKQISQKIIYSAWTERSNYDFALPWKYIKYDPTDVMTYVMDDGLTFQARMADMDLGQDFSIHAKGVATEMASYDSDVTAQGNGRVVPVPRVVSPHVRSVVWDIPYFEDTESVGDTGFNFYWGLRAYGPGFRFGSLSSKTLPNGGWDQMGVTAFDLVWGTIVGVVPPPVFGCEYTDYDTRIKLMPAFDFNANEGMYEWVSIADADWPSHENTIVIENEIIYFKNITVNGDGSITLDTLIRGARGTEDAAYTHRSGSVWAIRTGSFEDELMNFDKVGSDFLFRPSAPAIVPAGLPTLEASLYGASHRPWAPNDIRRAVAGSDIVFTWQRSTRLGGTLKGGTGTVPQVEGEEEYEFYLLDAPYDHRTFDPDDDGTYLRKFGPLTSATVTYTAAMMAADAKSLTSTLYALALQRNQFVGRGFPGWKTMIV